MNDEPQNLVYQIEIMDTREIMVCEDNQSVLSAMEQLGRTGIPVGCRGGGCGVCKVRVLKGEFVAKKMSREKISVDEEQAGLVLACRISPRSDLKLRVEGKMKTAIHSAPQEDVKQYWQQVKQQTSFYQQKKELLK